ncbi:MAG: D-alanyl-D-alanine carboxypeptidase [Candidatus Pacebacteria bacterium]|jgi:D-alanyl-D-alanine carboxypeptidase (penicillin-binding protein 5/6)|nr:D-alanyl-D-alanine carboxypeptidase [Candidatus Paceibacterota bacterium]
MNNDFPHIIETDETVVPKRFPIVMQLGILGFILLLLFGSLLLPKEKSTVTSTPPTPTQTAASAAPAVPQKFDDVDLRANAAYVWDVRSQRALYAKNEDEALPLASITKLMTALLAYELVEDEAEAIIPAAAINQEGSSGLSAGEHLSIEELRDLALISSSNDAAYALGASVGELLGDSDPASQFIHGMNIRADELGLASLEFWNTTGLDLSTTKPGAIGSARDVSFLMEYIITHHPEIITPTQETATRVYNAAGAYHEVSNTNEAATEIPNMIGSKTGYTDLAGGNLTIAFDAGFDRPIVITVLGSTRDERFTDVLTLVKAVQDSLGKTE